MRSKDMIRNSDLTKGGNGREISTRSKRSPEQREMDLMLISKLLLRENLTRDEIAAKIASERDYTLSQTMITVDIQELMKRWRDAYLSDIDILKGRELRRIDNLESAYWDSYDRSLKGTSSYKEDVTEFISDKIGEEDDEGTKRMKKYISRKMQDERDGEVKFLNGIQWCIDKRCEILGLNAPLKAEMTFDWRSEAQKQGIDPGVVFNDMVKRFVDGHIVEDVKELE